MVDATPSALAGRIGIVVAAARREQARSLADVARAAGLSKTILSRIERGEGNPSVETLWKLSQALDVPLGALVAEPARPRTRVVRAGAGEPAGADAEVAGWLLHTDPRARRGELFELRFEAGADQHRDGHLPGTEEIVVCVAGELVVGPAGEAATLAPGDAIWFAADAPHGYASAAGARALCWMTYDAAAGAGGRP